MSKQTRLNFQRTPSAPAKRRRLDSNNEPDNKELENKSSNQASKPQLRASTGAKKAKLTNNISSPVISSQRQEPGNSPNTTGDDSAQGKDSTSNSSSNRQSHGSVVHNAAKPSTNSSSSSPSPLADQNPNHITVSHLSASLFTSPTNTVLCHATNAQGTWGAGIAAAFKTHYPSAFKIYFAHCKKWPLTTLLGTTLLIPPQLKSPSKAEREAKHWIGCLFTSEKKGKGKGSKESILEATGEAVADLMRKVKDVNDDADADAEAGDEGIAGVRMCKINSGLFGVPWEASKAVIEGIEIEDVSETEVKEIVVCSVD